MENKQNRMKTAHFLYFQTSPNSKFTPNRNF